MHLRKISCNEHWIEVNYLQWQAAMMDTLNFRTEYHSVQVQVKSADTRYKTHLMSFNNLYYTGRFFNQRPLATDGNTASLAPTRQDTG